MKVGKDEEKKCADHVYQHAKTNLWQALNKT